MAQEKSMLTWGAQLKNSGYDSLTHALTAPRNVGWEYIETLDLPRYERTTFSLTEFLANPETALPPDDARRWFVILEPQDTTHTRYRKTLLARHEILPFILQTIQMHHLPPSEFEVSIIETEPQLFGGNIIIDSDGKMVMELSRGGQGVVADGSHSNAAHGKLFRMTREPHTHTFKYSWDDGEETQHIPLRAVAFETLLKIPHTGTGRNMQFTPGYYEFHLIKNSSSNLIEPRFVDARSDRALHTLK